MVKGREGCCAGPLAGLFRRRAGGRERGLTAAGDAGSEAGGRAAGQRAGLPLRPAAQGEAGQEGATLCHAMHLGADSTDDFDVLRSGRTGLVLGQRVLRVIPERRLTRRRGPLARRRRPGFFPLERLRQLRQLDVTAIWAAENGWTIRRLRRAPPRPALRRPQLPHTRRNAPKLGRWTIGKTPRLLNERPRRGPFYTAR